MNNEYEGANCIEERRRNASLRVNIHSNLQYCLAVSWLRSFIIHWLRAHFIQFRLEAWFKGSWIDCSLLLDDASLKLTLTESKFKVIIYTRWEPDKRLGNSERFSRFYLHVYLKFTQVTYSKTIKFGKQIIAIYGGMRSNDRRTSLLGEGEWLGCLRLHFERFVKHNI